MANTVYNNFVLENKLTDILLTSLDVNSFMTIDTSLTENDGMKKIIHTYSAEGDVEDVAEGVGNTKDITEGYTTSEYTVTTTQGRFIWTDEAAMTDSFLVDSGVQDLSKKMINNLTAKTITEFEKATLKVEYSTAPSFDDFADAIALLNKENDEQAGLFCLVNPKMKAVLRKAIKDDLKYVEGYTRSGYIGSICGVPIYVSKAVSDDEIIIASKKAVTCFSKKATETELDRDKNTRKNIMYARFVNVVALTDAKEVVLIKKANA